MFPVQDVRRYCKNYAVNAILSFYAEKAEKTGIATQFQIQMGEPLLIPETEFCVLIGNLLENAVDACAETDDGIQPFIRLHVCQTSSSMFSITADNTSASGPTWSGDRLLSTKHTGYGIRNRIHPHDRRTLPRRRQILMERRHVLRLRDAEPVT